MPQQHLLSDTDRIRHVASISRPLAGFARNSKVWAHSVKQLSHHIRKTRLFKNDFKIAIWSIKRTTECGTSFDQLRKPVDIPDITLFTVAAPAIGLRIIQIKDNGLKIIGMMSNYIMKIMKTLFRRN